MPFTAIHLSEKDVRSSSRIWLLPFTRLVCFSFLPCQRRLPPRTRNTLGTPSKYSITIKVVNLSWQTRLFTDMKGSIVLSVNDEMQSEKACSHANHTLAGNNVSFSLNAARKVGRKWPDKRYLAFIATRARTQKWYVYNRKLPFQTQPNKCKTVLGVTCLS